MPESPRTRYRGRPRAASVTGNPGHLAGRETPRVPLKGWLGSSPPPGPPGRVRRAITQQAWQAHRVTLHRYKAGRYEARCKCGRWKAVWPKPATWKAATVEHRRHVKGIVDVECEKWLRRHRPQPRHGHGEPPRGV